MPISVLRLTKDHPRIRGESEKITVRACAGKYEHQHIVLDAVDQEPVGGDVAFAKALIIPGKRMVAVALGQWRFCTQQIDNGFE